MDSQLAVIADVLAKYPGLTCDLCGRILDADGDAECWVVRREEVLPVQHTSERLLANKLAHLHRNCFQPGSAIDETRLSDILTGRTEAPQVIGRLVVNVGMDEETAKLARMQAFAAKLGGTAKAHHPSPAQGIFPVYIEMEVPGYSDADLARLAVEQKF
jgi:hypothetical protein